MKRIGKVAVLLTVVTFAMASTAGAAPSVPAGYTAQVYLSTLPNNTNDIALAFSPSGLFGRPAELYASYDWTLSGAPNHNIYDIHAQNNASLFGGPSGQVSAMAFSNPSSAFGSYLYVAIANGANSIARIDSNGIERPFATLISQNMDGMKFGPGGGWGGNLYVLTDSAGTIEVLDANGIRHTLVQGLPIASKGLDISAGGIWGQYAYVASAGYGITRVSPAGAKTPFITDLSVLGTGYELSLAIDQEGLFGGDMFVSVMNSGSIFRIQPDGNVSLFASGFNFGASVGNTHDGDIAFGPDGFMYVAEGGTGTVWQIVPEPATLSLLALGGLAVMRRRRTAPGMAR